MTSRTIVKQADDLADSYAFAARAPNAGYTHGELSAQAGIARALGSAFVANVLEAGQRQVYRAPRIEACIAQWSGDRAAAALAMRFNAGLHALARSGLCARLTQLYRKQSGDFDGIIGKALEDHDLFVAQWMRHPTQTNEINRSAAILAALMVVSNQFGLPFELLELGSSAGLNLNIAHYGYRLGTLQVGDPSLPLQIAPSWQGHPLAAPVEILTARGVDLHPLQISDPHTCERLHAYIWADQRTRARNLESALEIARLYPPRVDKGNALDWLHQQLAEPQDDGVCRVVFHSMFRQYLDETEQRTMQAALSAAGAKATSRRPLVHISYEWTSVRDEVRLMLRCWPGDTDRLLAICHPYGAWFDWRG